MNVVVELSETGVAVIIQQITKNLHAVVDNDMDILIGIETVVLLVVIGTITEEIGRVVTHLHMTNEPLYITHALRVSSYVVMQNVDAGLLTLHGVLLLGHKGLRQQEEK